MPVNVRIIAATNRDLRSLIAQGKFREDLFQRLNVLPIEMPPLRDRKGDIPELARYFAAQVAKRDGRTVPELAPDFIAYVMQQDWQEGNLRELRNFVEREVILNLSDVLHAPRSARTRVLRIPIQGARKLREIQETRERQAIEQALRAYRGNQSKAADALGLKESTLRAKMAKYGIQGRRKLRFD